jgi:sugar lactone lactonase YvrE
MQAVSIVSSQNQLGEGPIWSVEEQALYWVDIYGKCIERYDPQTHLRKTFQLPCKVGAAAFRKRGGFVLATDQGFAFWDGQSDAVELVSNPEIDKPLYRFNDGKIDPGGRFWAGTMYDGPQQHPRPEGTLYRLDPDGSISLMEKGVLISNGIGWSPDHRIMYYTDSIRKIIYAYDFDPATGEISNRRTFVHTPDESGEPDGLTVDSLGFVWSARWNGWKVTRYNPKGEVDLVIQVPAACPSSVMFGGRDLKDLFITSAWKELSSEERNFQPLAGNLFTARVDVQGLPEFQFAG